MMQTGSISKKKHANTFLSILNLLKVKHTQNYSTRYFNEHPHKYNLFGLSKMLSSYQVENVAFRLENKEEAIHELETPFIAHAANNFISVYNVTPEAVHYVMNGLDHKIKIEQFCKIWSGVVLLPESDTHSIEPGYQTNRKKEMILSIKKSLLTVGICVLFLLYYFIQQPSYSPGIWLSILLNIGGLYICTLLLKKQMHSESSYADKICSLFKQSDCNNILESDAAKLFGLVGWSEIGFSYFLGNLFILLFLPGLLFYYSLINILALPYSFWSVWYQKIKAKEWCPLCLIVQGVFWGIFLVNLIFSQIAIPMFDIPSILLTGCLFGIPLLAINILLPQLADTSQTEKLTQEMNSLKAKDEVFVSVLRKEMHYPVDKSVSQIVFGNPEAKNLITILTNPHCNPCAKMHPRVKQLLQDTQNEYCVQYIFSSFSDELKESNRFLIAHYLKQPAEVFATIIEEWFEGGKFNREGFYKKYPIEFDEQVEKEYAKHEEWIEETKLKATPTILFNGHALPDIYKIEDIKFFTQLEIN